MTLTAATLDALLAPRSVAIVGASDDPTRISGRPVRYLRESGFTGGIYPVNPNRQVVQGLPAFASVDDLPEVPDVALIAVAADRAVDALEQCAAAGVRGAIVFSAGFAETGTQGAELQERVAALARESGMRVVGPNCLGVFNARGRFFGTFANALDRELPAGGPLAVASQSGAYGTHLYSLARLRGLPVGYMVTTGNEADVDVAEAIGWLAARDDVAVIVAQAEGIRDGAGFLDALTVAHDRRTPIVLLKAGRSEAGARAAGSHTAALAGADDVFDAVCAEYGVHRATTTDEQLDVAYGCLRGILPAGRKLGVVTVSGGAGVQICDAAERANLEVPPLPEAVRDRLRARFPYAVFDNPLDTTAQALQDWDVVVESVGAALGEGGFDAVIAFFTAVPLARPFAGPLQDALERAAAPYPDRLIVVSCLAEADTRAAYEAAGFLVFDDSDRAVTTIAALASLREGFDRPLRERAAVSPPLELATGTEDEAKRLLAAAGVPVLPERVARSAAEASAAAAELGLPVAVKALSAEILHKSDVGGVLLGVEDAAAAYGELTRRLGVAAVLVAPMAAEGVDVIVGAHRDPVFGPVVLFGLGGIFVEVLGDVALRLAPVDEAAAHGMIRSVRGYPLLAGARGREPADLGALARAIVAVSRFALSVDSVDVNPLRVFASGAAALDAVVVPVKGAGC